MNLIQFSQVKLLQQSPANQYISGSSKYIEFIELRATDCASLDRVSVAGHAVILIESVATIQEHHRTSTERDTRPPNEKLEVTFHADLSNSPFRGLERYYLISMGAMKGIEPHLDLTAKPNTPGLSCNSFAGYISKMLRKQRNMFVKPSVQDQSKVSALITLKFGQTSQATMWNQIKLSETVNKRAQLKRSPVYLDEEQRRFIREHMEDVLLFTMDERAVLSQPLRDLVRPNENDAAQQVLRVANEVDWGGSAFDRSLSRCRKRNEDEELGYFSASRFQRTVPTPGRANLCTGKFVYLLEDC
jgi:hypothetical protein